MKNSILMIIYFTLLLFVGCSTFVQENEEITVGPCVLIENGPSLTINSIYESKNQVYLNYIELQNISLIIQQDNISRDIFNSSFLRAALNQNNSQIFSRLFISNLSLIDNRTLNCTLPCSFGTETDVNWKFNININDKIENFSLNAKYNSKKGSCPLILSEGEIVDLII